MYQAMPCSVVFFIKTKMPCHSSSLSSVFVDEAPHVLVAKTKSNQSEGSEATPSVFMPHL